MVAHSSEFENIIVREEEQDELEMLGRTLCPLDVKGGPTDKYGKISILIQVFYISNFVFFVDVCVTYDLHFTVAYIPWINSELFIDV